jgi:two-component system cell cycle sensor histidine kinase/response regulator CckA
MHAQSPDPATPAPRGTILLVEDDPDVGRKLTKVLRREGYRVLWADHPAEAVRIARTAAEPLDLVVTDVVLPEMSGPEVAEHIVALRPGTRVLYVSGYLGETVLEPGEAIFGEGLLLKPFSPVELVSRIRSILEHPG